MEVNWKLLVMKFKMGETIMTLEEDPGSMTLGSLLRLWPKHYNWRGRDMARENVSNHRRHEDCRQFALEHYTIVGMLWASF